MKHVTNLAESLAFNRSENDALTSAIDFLKSNRQKLDFELEMRLDLILSRYETDFVDEQEKGSQNLPDFG